MSTFEFVTVLLSIVVGLGITRLLGGLGRAIEIRGSFKGYWVQALWSVTVGLWFLVFWWVVVFSYQNYERWVFINFVHLLLYATLLYLLSVLIIPRDLKPGTDLEKHFFKVRPWFFGIAALVSFVEMADSLMHGLDNLLSFGPFYLLMQTSGVVFSLVAARTTSRRFHAIWSVVCFVTIIGWTATRFWSIG
jgi:hypothetical protein